MDESKLKSPVSPLHQGVVGEEYQIAFIAPELHSLSERLSGLGVAPGAKLRLSQKRPAFVVKVGETEVALDREIAGGIYIARDLLL